MITRETLKSCSLKQTSHYDGQGFFGYTYQCVEHPRLGRDDRYIKKPRSVESTWWVDGEKRASLDDALAALNVPVVITDADRHALAHVPADYEDIRRNEKPGLAALERLAQKGLVEWHDRKCRRTAAATGALRS